MGMMSSIVISANATMSSRLQTDNLAHLIALSIREAQTKALSASAPVGATNASSVPGYGVYISGAQNTVTSFTETGTNMYYREGESAADTPTPLGRGFTISDLTAVRAGVSETLDITGVSIYFKRPKQDAKIYYTVGGAMIEGQSATISIRAPRGGLVKNITVTATGQISVQ